MSDDLQARIAEVWNSMDESWESFGKILEDKCRANAGKVALMTPREHITYAQLDDRVNRVGNALEALGVGKGDKVCLMLPNTSRSFFTRGGATPSWAA